MTYIQYLFFINCVGFYTYKMALVRMDGKNR